MNEWGLIKVVLNWDNDALHLNGRFWPIAAGR